MRGGEFVRLLFIGDVVGQPGMTALQETLAQLQTSLKPDLTIANGENAAHGGRGMTRAIMQSFRELGIDVITLGNHSWDQEEIFDFIEEEDALIRPANFPAGTPGAEYAIINKDQHVVGIVNLMGRSFLPPLDCPFRKADELIETIRRKTPVILLDFHAEATAEKLAMGWYLDGRVSAVIGTHTHVQTADERILPNGTAFMTDVGMVGPYDGVIGFEREGVLRRFLTHLPVRFEVQKGRWQFNAAVIDVDAETGKAERIQRLRIDDDHPWLD